MCVGIPMRVVESNGFVALCEGRGERQNVNVMLVETAPPGQWVLVHLGSAQRLLDEQEATEINDALDALAAVLNGKSTEGYFADLTVRPN